MKIAISLPDDVFLKVKKAAEEQKRSRSELFVEAVKIYLDRIESLRILQALDEVYAEPDTQRETDARTAELDLYRRTVLEKEKW